MQIEQIRKTLEATSHAAREAAHREHVNYFANELAEAEARLQRQAVGVREHHEFACAQLRKIADETRDRLEAGLAYDLHVGADPAKRPWRPLPEICADLADKPRAASAELSIAWSAACERSIVELGAPPAPYHLALAVADTMPASIRDAIGSQNARTDQRILGAAERLDKLIREGKHASAVQRAVLDLEVALAEQLPQYAVQPGDAASVARMRGAVTRSAQVAALAELRASPATAPTAPPATSTPRRAKGDEFNETIAEARRFARK